MPPADEPPAGYPSRRQFLKRAGLTAGGLVTAGGIGFGVSELLSGSPSHRRDALRRLREPESAQTFQSRPDLAPPSVAAIARPAASDGYLFLGPGAEPRKQIQAGPLILDGDGEPVWFSPLSAPGWIANFHSWELRRRPVLAWWEGQVELPLGYGHGEGVVVDASYRELTRIRAVGPLPMDVHELRLTPQGTALFTCHPRTVERDLTGLGGARRAPVLESVFQEVDLATGRLLLEWRSLDHIPLEESYRPVAEPYDYVHINSIAVCPDGNLLVSGRHTWAVYKLDRRTGEVIWRLGGKRSDFAMARGAQFSWQHDAQYPDESTISLFDDRSDGKTRTASHSRGLVLAVDLAGKRARVAREYVHPQPLLSVAMGSMQLLPNAHAVVGWGTQPYLSEYDADGQLVADVRLARGEQSYRGFRLPWHGWPTELPAAVVVSRRGGATRTLYASWNGATEAAYWQLRAGPHPRNLRTLRTVPRAGFETAIDLGSGSGWVAATALDAGGVPLAASRPVRVQD